MTIGVIALIAAVLSGGFLLHKLIRKMKPPKKKVEIGKPVLVKEVIPPVEKVVVKPPLPKKGKKPVKLVGLVKKRPAIPGKEKRIPVKKLKTREIPPPPPLPLEWQQPVAPVEKPLSPKAKKFFFGLPAAAITFVVAIFTFFSSPIVAILANIGITGTNLSGAIEMAGELEQLERFGQITLTGDQKRAISQLKNMTRLPITRGLVKSFALKKSLHDVVKNALESNPALGSTIAFGQPKKARAIIAKYIKLKWKEGNSQKAVNELDKEKEPKVYKRVVASLQKFKAQIAALDAKYINLSKAPELQNAVQEFRAKADRILEGLKKQVLAAERQEPAVELRPMAVPL